MNSIERNRNAFTLVELITVVAIVAVLIGILFPAIHAIRESARRTQCSNNVRQIATALHNFESSFQKLPNGINSPTSRSFPSSTWLTMILPQIERNNAWDQACADYTSTGNPFSGHVGMRTVIPSFGCPSDPESGIEHWTNNGRMNLLVASTNFLGVNGTDFQREDGIFYLESGTKFRDIRDGLSSTLMIGERPPSPDFWYGWWYAGNGQEHRGSPDMLLGVREINEKATKLESCDRGPYNYTKGNNEMCDTFHFWSHHPGGANFALADGSVKFIPYNANDVMPALATRADSDSFDEPW